MEGYKVENSIQEGRQEEPIELPTDRSATYLAEGSKPRAAGKNIYRLGKGSMSRPSRLQNKLLVRRPLVHSINAAIEMCRVEQTPVVCSN